MMNGIQHVFPVVLYEINYIEDENMSKKTIIILTVAIFMALFSGCGQKENELLSDDQTEIEDYSSNDPEIETDVPVTNEKNHYECMEEIKNASPESGFVQIDDMLFRYRASISEAIEAIKGSSENFTFKNEYNENELVAPNSHGVQIILLKDDDWYFELGAGNLTDETIPLKDCTIMYITAYGASKGNVYYAGFKENDNETITYDYVKEAMKDYEIFQEKTIYNGAGKKFLNITYEMSSELNQSDKVYVFFVFDSDTNELTAFEIHSTNSVNIPT